MKSNHQDKSLRTSCKECIFSVYTDNTQTGCRADRLEKFETTGRLIEAYDDDKEFYVIDCLCNCFRPPTWNGGKADLEKAINEIKPSFVIAVFLDQANEDSCRATLDSILSLDYDKDRIFICLSQPLVSSPAERLISTQLFMELTRSGFQCEVVISVSSAAREYDLFKKMPKGFTHILKVPAGIELCSNIFQQIDQELNSNLTRAVVFDKICPSVGTPSVERARIINATVFLTRYADYGQWKPFEENISTEAIATKLYMELQDK